MRGLDSRSLNSRCNKLSNWELLLRKRPLQLEISATLSKILRPYIPSFQNLLTLFWKSFYIVCVNSCLSIRYILWLPVIYKSMYLRFLKICFALQINSQHTLKYCCFIGLYTEETEFTIRRSWHCTIHLDLP
jgi:hypothetical protein